MDGHYPRWLEHITVEVSLVSVGCKSRNPPFEQPASRWELSGTKVEPNWLWKQRFSVLLASSFVSPPHTSIPAHLHYYFRYPYRARIRGQIIWQRIHSHEGIGRHAVSTSCLLLVGRLRHIAIGKGQKTTKDEGMERLKSRLFDGAEQSTVQGMNDYIIRYPS